VASLEGKLRLYKVLLGSTFAPDVSFGPWDLWEQTQPYLETLGRAFWLLERVGLCLAPRRNGNDSPCQATRLGRLGNPPSLTGCPPSM
jgi:hypothetical protein